jgi:hypothetical protein
MTTIVDALFILALDDEEGDIVPSAAVVLESMMGCAILAELVLRERVDLVDGRIVAKDPTPMNETILDKALYQILEMSRSRKLKYWVNTFSYENCLDEVGHDLVQKGVLTRHKKRLFLAKPKAENSQSNNSFKFQLKNRLREIVLEKQQPEVQDKVLLAFLFQDDLLKLITTHGERKAARKWIRRNILDENGLSSSLKEILAISC